MNLPENPEKIKLPGPPLFANDRLFLAALLVAVALVSFGLGRMTAGTPIATRTPAAALSPAGEDREAAAAPIAPPAAATSTEAAPAAAGMYVGSKNSDKYHLPWCAGARSISEQNKVWFASKEEAATAGYTPASNCKGI